MKERSVCSSRQRRVLLPPELTEGAGSLVYYAHVTNRQVMVEVSTDGISWTSVDSYKETSDWSKHTVFINDPAVRYVKLYTNSNNQVYIDKFVVTRADGTMADGTVLVRPLMYLTSHRILRPTGYAPAARRPPRQRQRLSCPDRESGSTIMLIRLPMSHIL